jgi:hypothetical protein
MKVKISNQQKYENYKSMMEQLKKAMKYGFYLEANAILFAAIEDRTDSLLKYMGIQRKRGDRLGSFDGKLKRFESELLSGKWNVKSKLSVELIQAGHKWRLNRNDIVHAYANLQLSQDKLKTHAEEGLELVRAFDSVSGAFKRAMLRRKK